MKKNLNLLLMIMLVFVILTGCADVSHVQECLPDNEYTYGFWSGTWHGMISFFSFIGSLFDNEIAVYAINNNGGWYDFGFVGGFGIILKLSTNLLKIVFA